MNKQMLRSEVMNELTTRIIPYWQRLRDAENGGFYGLVDLDLNVDKQAPKGVILHSRILWFFSKAYLLLGDEELLSYAEHSYKFLTENCMDKVNGGMYWMLSWDRQVTEDIKHTYNQAFAIYALAAYYEASADAAVLEQAMELFKLVEEKARDASGYLEAFSAEWELVENDKLSENGIIAEKTMNTLLHLLEAYTALYEVTGDCTVRGRLVWLLEEFEKNLYNPEKKRLEVFFNSSMESLIDLHSFGHDIEAAWLLDRACEVLGDDGLTKMTQNYTRKIAPVIFTRAVHGGAVDNECFDGEVEKTHIWWVEAEAVVGFYNHYEKTGDEMYLKVVYEIWEYIKKYILDGRSNGEWYSEVDDNGHTTAKNCITEPWKCPYHNGRMCIEIISRIDAEHSSSFWDKANRAFTANNELVARRNSINTDFYNGIFDRWNNPVLTRDHIPVFWKYDLNEQTNPYFMERLGVNATFNTGAMYHRGKYYLVARVEGNDRKSFFAVAESDNGCEGFRFWDYPVILPDTVAEETNVYDMRLTAHTDGYIYGVFCSESKDAENDDLSAAVAQAGIVRTKDLMTWERLPNLKTTSPQQRNVVLHPEYVDGQYAFYTRPQDDFISTGSGGGVGFGLCRDITNAVIDKETIISKRRYHTITEAKNGAGAVPIKTERGWIHIAHGVRNTAAGLRYVLYVFATDLNEPWRLIAEPSGFFIAPLGVERVGDVSNVVFTNGAVVNEHGEVYIYYASDDTRLHVATTTVDKLIDYTFNTPVDPLRSVDCVKLRCELISKNIEIMKSLGMTRH